MCGMLIRDRGVNNSFEGRTGYGIFRDFKGFLGIFRGFFRIFRGFSDFFLDFSGFFLKSVRDFSEFFTPRLTYL